MKLIVHGPTGIPPFSVSLRAKSTAENFLDEWRIALQILHDAIQLNTEKSSRVYVDVHVTQKLHLYQGGRPSVSDLDLASPGPVVIIANKAMPMRYTYHWAVLRGRKPAPKRLTSLKVFRDSNPDFRINSDPDVYRIAPKMLWIPIPQ